MDGRISRGCFLLVAVIVLLGLAPGALATAAPAAPGIELTPQAGPMLAVGPTLPTLTAAPLNATVPAKADVATTHPASHTPAEVPATMPAATTTEARKPIESTPIRPETASSTASKETVKTPARRSSMADAMYSAMQVAAALAIVVGLILLGRAFMRRFVPGAAVGSGKGVIETLARYPIGRNQSVILLRIGSQIVALNQTKDASQSILVVSEPVEVARIIGQIEGQDPNSIQQNFNRVLSNARMDLETPDTIDVLEANKTQVPEEDLDTQLEEMAAAKRQLMELRAQVRSVRENLPT